MRETETIDLIKKHIEKDEVDTVISDMSPDISGNYDMDQARSVYLCMMAFKTCEIFLKPDGNFICKVFEGKDLDDFLNDIKNRFTTIKRFNPKASRKSSSEIYIIAKNFNLKNKISKNDKI